MTFPAEDSCAGQQDHADREMRLLVYCARVHLDARHEQRIAELLRDELDWPRVLDLAARHKLLPLVWWHLRADAAAIPNQWAHALKRAFVENAGRMLRLSGELLDVAHLLRSRGIPVVPYKGPALGAYLYGNLALRQSGDLDLLVSRSDAARARAVLLECGYRPRHALAPGGVEFMFGSRYSEELTRDGVNVELHWAFTNGDVALPLDLDELTPRLTATRLGGRAVAMFGHEDLLLILCVHGCKHRWDRLEWLCGVAEVLRAGSGDVNWERLEDRARRLGVHRMLQLGVLLAHDILGAPLPRGVVALARAQPAVARLAREVPTLFTAPVVDTDGASSLATDLFRFRLRERPTDRLRFLWYRLTTPSRPEAWSTIEVGRHRIPVHGVLRPFRVLARLPAAIRRYSSRRADDEQTGSADGSGIGQSR